MRPAHLPGTLEGKWVIVSDGDPYAAAIYRRHYSCRTYADGRRCDRLYRNRNLIVGPGEKMVLLAYASAGSALWAWRRFIDASGQTGVNNAVFRNEGPIRSSELIIEACRLAWDRWPGQRLYTYVDPAKITSRNPGYCYIAAGWRPCGWTKSGKRILECYPNEKGRE